MVDFSLLVTVRPEYTETLGLKNLRHPIREKIHKDRYVPNDVYATQQSRYDLSMRPKHGNLTDSCL